MGIMTNPMDALASLQAEIFNGIPLMPCKLHPELRMFVDQPNGSYRFTFAKIESKIIKAFVTFVFGDPVDEIPCVNIGYAVPSEYRRQGLATEIINKSINEIKFEFQRNGILSFYVEAVIGVNNLASIKTAEKLLMVEPEEIIDSVSGEKAYYYHCLIQ